MDEEGYLILNPALGWKTMPEGSATTIAASFDPSLAGKYSSTPPFSKQHLAEKC